MREKPAPAHVTNFVEELVECGVQLASILDHMYRHESDDPAVPPPPDVLRDLVANTIEPHLARRKKALHAATELLAATSDIIADEIFVVEPGAFDNLEEGEFDIPFDPPGQSGFLVREDERLH